jgi:hypothetical protein
MAKDCNCAGSRCGCKLVAGTGMGVSGTGTAVDPFIVSRDSDLDSIEGKIDVDDTTTIDMTRLGSGTTADPYVIKAAIKLASPDGTFWTITVANDGTLSAVEV